MADESFEDDEIGIYCPACSYENKKSVGWVRKHSQLECQFCGATVDLESKNFCTVAAGKKR